MHVDKNRVYPATVTVNAQPLHGIKIVRGVVLIPFMLVIRRSAISVLRGDVNVCAVCYERYFMGAFHGDFPYQVLDRETGPEPPRRGICTPVIERVAAGSKSIIPLGTTR